MESRQTEPLRHAARHCLFAAPVLALVAGATAVCSAAPDAEGGAALERRATAEVRRLDRLKRRLVDVAAATRAPDDQIVAKDAAL